jgi:NAD(P)-dependent dehydrogenase (short-subunit alcohol dehydrogenase family)
MKLKDQVAIVTGAGSGIGRAIALKLAKEGADIVIVYHKNYANAEESAQMIKNIGRQALVYKADVGDINIYPNLINVILNNFGRIDCLVNNAGIFIPKPLLEMTEEIWDETLDTNLKAALFGTQAVARHWVKVHKSGKVVNIGSIHATRSWVTLTAYASSKVGLKGLTKIMASELAPYKINVNMVSPGLIATDITKEWAKNPDFKERIHREIALDRMGNPEEVANLVLFLVCDEGNYITGTELIIDGGLLLYSYSI